MPERVFISFSSADQTAVTTFEEALYQAGLRPWIDLYEIGGGDPIQKQIHEAIKTAKAAIFCLSDNILRTEWVHNEFRWCEQQHHITGLKLIPVQIGELTLDKAPDFVKRWHQSEHFLDAREPTRMRPNMANTLATIRGALGLSERAALNVALLAMDKAEYAALCAAPRHHDERWQALETLCKASGTPAEMSLTALSGRYGTNPEDFAPFADVPLLRIFEDCIANENHRRLAARRSKELLWIRWWTAQNVIAAAADAHAWATLRDGYTIIVVDSLSIFSSRVADALRELPTAASADQRSILWLPPNSRYTSSLADEIHKTLTKVPHLVEAFRERGRLARTSSFDLGTLQAFQLLLYHVILREVEVVRPTPRRVAAMRTVGTPSVSSTQWGRR